MECQRSSVGRGRGVAVAEDQQSPHVRLDAQRGAARRLEPRKAGSPAALHPGQVRERREHALPARAHEGRVPARRGRHVERVEVALVLLPRPVRDHLRPLGVGDVDANDARDPVHDALDGGVVALLEPVPLVGPPRAGAAALGVPARNLRGVFHLGHGHLDEVLGLARRQHPVVDPDQRGREVRREARGPPAPAAAGRGRAGALQVRGNLGVVQQLLGRPAEDRARGAPGVPMRSGARGLARRPRLTGVWRSAPARRMRGQEKHGGEPGARGPRGATGSLHGRAAGPQAG
mmetsp:Transcript_118282/g.335466  ORF Transcript_118282/g.335466 Transcript_118282/m.335466 type:complete len:290 (+) Transcript_118282:146-1015(+)